MRALFFHCKRYEIEITSLATRPKSVKPEEVKEKKQKCNDCIVVLVTVGKKDKIKEVVQKLTKEIIKTSKNVGRKNVVICPFAHLSNKLGSSEKSIKILKLVEEKLKNKVGVMRSHFGSHKSLLLDVYGHPGNVKYREF